MPTYDYQCITCRRTASVFQSISDYVRAPARPACCDLEMERRLSVVPAMSGLANALAGDRHYDGLRAPDGADISTRSKHREYMKSRGLADAGDFSGVWDRADKDRQAIRTGTFQDKELRQDLTQKVMTAVAQPD